MKASHLLKGYFNMEVDVYQALKYLAVGGAKTQILLFYNQMLKNGYVLYGGCSVNPPENSTRKLHGLNLIYSNSQVKFMVDEA